MVMHLLIEAWTSLVKTSQLSMLTSRISVPTH
jgi:hypothetical protein